MRHQNAQLVAQLKELKDIVAENKRLAEDNKRLEEGHKAITAARLDELAKNQDTAEKMQDGMSASVVEAYREAHRAVDQGNNLPGVLEQVQGHVVELRDAVFPRLPGSAADVPSPVNAVSTVTAAPAATNVASAAEGLPHRPETQFNGLPRVPPSQCPQQ